MRLKSAFATMKLALPELRELAKDWKSTKPTMLIPFEPEFMQEFKEQVAEVESHISVLIQGAKDPSARFKTGVNLANCLPATREKSIKKNPSHGDDHSSEDDSVVSKITAGSGTSRFFAPSSFTTPNMNTGLRMARTPAEHAPTKTSSQTSDAQTNFLQQVMELKTNPSLLKALADDVEPDPRWFLHYFQLPTNDPDPSKSKRNNLKRSNNQCDRCVLEGKPDCRFRHQEIIVRRLSEDGEQQLALHLKCINPRSLTFELPVLALLDPCGFSRKIFDHFVRTLVVFDHLLNKPNLTRVNPATTSVEEKATEAAGKESDRNYEPSNQSGTDLKRTSGDAN